MRHHAQAYLANSWLKKQAAACTHCNFRANCRRNNKSRPLDSTTVESSSRSHHMNCTHLRPQMQFQCIPSTATWNLLLLVCQVVPTYTRNCHRHAGNIPKRSVVILRNRRPLEPTQSEKQKAKHSTGNSICPAEGRTELQHIPTASQKIGPITQYIDTEGISKNPPKCVGTKNITVYVWFFLLLI